MTTTELVRFVARCLAETTTLLSITLIAGGLHGWLAVIAAMVAACAVGQFVDHVLTDERIDTGIASVRGFFARLKAKAA